MTRRALAVVIVLVGLVVWSSGPSSASAPAAFGYAEIELVADSATLVALPTTTGVAQVTDAYDAPTTTRVVGEELASGKSAPVLLGDVRYPSALSPADAADPSTTPLAVVDATEAGGGQRVIGSGFSASERGSG